MVNLNVSRDDAGRMLSYVRQRRRKAERGLKKFESQFDPTLGANMLKAHTEASALEGYIQEQIDAHDSENTRQPS